MAKSKAKAEHYVNNKEFLAAMVEYKKTVDKARSSVDKTNNAKRNISLEKEKLL